MVAFGESFDCLANSRVHKWVEIFFSLARTLAISQALSRFPKFVQGPMKLWAIPMTVKSDVQMLEQLNAVGDLLYILGSINTNNHASGEN